MDLVVVGPGIGLVCLVWIDPVRFGSSFWTPLLCCDLIAIGGSFVASPLLLVCLRLLSLFSVSITLYIFTCSMLHVSLSLISASIINSRNKP